jgi:signal transduction histidine kinase/ligand-binding sensor protein
VEENSMAEISDFIKKTQPKNILEIISEDVLERLLDSYRFPLQTPLSVYYTKTGTEKETIEWLGIELPTREEEKFFCLFCHTYRDIPPICKEKCKQCDMKITLKYYNGEWEGPKLFHCHLRLWDMTYPLLAKGRLVGVLYGGQVIVTKKVNNWTDGLKDVINEVVWDQFNDKATNVTLSKNQTDDIIAAVNARDEITPIKKNQLKNAIKKIKEGKTSVKNLVERYKKFREFGKTLNKVLEDLYAAQAEAARYEHAYSKSRMLAEAGDQLKEEENKFWKTLDEVVKETLPDVCGYVLYELDKYREAFEPMQTCVYNKEIIPDEGGFRNFCKYVFNELHEKGKKKRNLITYNLLDEKNTPQIFRELFLRSVSDWNKITKGAMVVVIPLAENDGKIAGGLVCLCIRGKQEGISRRDFSGDSTKFYIKTMEGIVDVLSMVLDRHSIVQAQADAWAVRSHELVAPINAVKGYQDNLQYLFKDCIEPELSESPDVRNMFSAQVTRLGELCDLLELIAKGGSGEGKEYFIKVSYEKKILLPIVQPLRDHGKREKDIKIYYSASIAGISNLYLFVDGMKRCMFNLIFNAIKYSNKKSKITIELQELKDDYEIDIINEGIGVPMGEEELIFQKFRQGSNADIVAAYGAGLGLPVAREMARKQGGDVRLINGAREKTIFALILPKSLEFGPPSKSFIKES